MCSKMLMTYFGLDKTKTKQVEHKIYIIEMQKRSTHCKRKKYDFGIMLQNLGILSVTNASLTEAPQDTPKSNIR